MLILKNKGKKVFTDDQPTVSSLVKGRIGVQKRSRVYLYPEEAMYLIDIRNAECPLSFNDLMKRPAKYYGYKAWRDRGLYILHFNHPAVKSELKNIKAKLPVRKYKGTNIKFPKLKFNGKFYKNDLTTVVDNYPDTAKNLYFDHWFGQMGTYKSEHRGKFYFFDVYETLFLSDINILQLSNSDREKVMKAGLKKHKFFDLMYSVYYDWVSKGFVLKTGFKFGSHFRLYFPGAAPKCSGKKWIHSKHVIHVFPYKHKLLISEWSRAIRVAHSVRKTFILAIPKREKDKLKNVTLDYVLYHRRKNNVKKPMQDKPSYVMWCASEEEYIGGAELAYALHKAKQLGLGLILAISDRETSVTFYRVIKINLPDSVHEYYELEWVLP